MEILNHLFSRVECVYISTIKLSVACCRRVYSHTLEILVLTIKKQNQKINKRLDYVISNPGGGTVLKTSHFLSSPQQTLPMSNTEQLTSTNSNRAAQMDL